MWNAERRGCSWRGFRSCAGRGRDSWDVRPIDDLNRDLSACYGLPVETASKRAGFAVVAKALERGEIALAQIAAVLLQLPDPPPLAKLEGRDRPYLAVELFRSGLLKGDWDSDKHPRIGTPPNPGWFAPREDEAEPKPSRIGWPSPHVNVRLRALLVEAIEAFDETGRYFAWGMPALDAIAAFLAEFEPTELNGGEDRVIAQWRASLQPPKALDELRAPPTEDPLGYEMHHIVEQNPDNVAKSGKRIDKFGRAAIDDPNNIVWVPRLLLIPASAFAAKL